MVGILTFSPSDGGKSAVEKHLNSDGTNIVLHHANAVLATRQKVQQGNQKQPGFDSQLTNFRVIFHYHSSFIFILKQDFNQQIKAKFLFIQAHTVHINLNSQRWPWTFCDTRHCGPTNEPWPTRHRSSSHPKLSGGREKPLNGHEWTSHFTFIVTPFKLDQHSRW